MKKVIGLLIALLLVASILALPTKTAKANYSTDVTCGFMDDTHYENVNAGGGYYQTFYPHESRLTSAVLTLAAFQTDSTATVKILNSGGNELASQSLTVTGSDPVEYNAYSFDGFSAITVTPGQMYKLVLIRSAGATLYWYKNTNCAIQGNAYADNFSLPAADYVFTIYGYTPASPDIPEEDTQIAAPTDASAEYIASNNKVKVSWTKSETTDIDGYRVYRSENKTKDYTKIGQVEKQIAEYFDTTIAANVTYYYYITAYKASDEGIKSNIAQVAIPASVVKKKTIPTMAAASNPTNWFFYLLFGGVALLLIIFFIIYELKLKKIWARPKKPDLTK